MRRSTAFIENTVRANLNELTKNNKFNLDFLEKILKNSQKMLFYMHFLIKT